MGLGRYQIFASGGDDTLALQALFDAAHAAGGYQIVIAIGAFTLSGPITPYSNIDFELDGSLTFTFASPTAAIQFAGITHSVWRGGIISRGGVISPTGLAPAIRITGNCDRTLVFRDMEIASTIVDAITEQQSAVRVEGGSPTFDNVVARASSGATGPVPAGFMVGGFGNTPLFIDCTGYGGGGNQTAGFFFQDGTAAICIGCAGYGGAAAVGEADGIIVWDSASPTLRDCYGQGGDNATTYAFGLLCDGGSGSPTVQGGGASGGLNGEASALRIGGATSPVITGFTGRPRRSSQWGVYAAANNGRFQPFANYRYQLISIFIYVNTVQAAGVTVNIGTTPGGSEVAAAIPIGTSQQFQYFNFARVAVAAGGYLYFTTSAPVPDGCFQASYTVAYDGGHQTGLELDTKGYATISGSTFEASDNGQCLQIAPNAHATLNWTISECAFIKYSATGTGSGALYDPIGGLVGAPIFNSRFRGGINGVASFADNSNSFLSPSMANSGVATVAAGLTSLVVNHGLLSAPSNIQLTPLGNPGAALWWVDTVTATQFAIHLTGALGSPLSFNWQARVL